MPDIFISYRREDSAGYAGRLYDDLRPLLPGGRIFIDMHAIAPGVDFIEQIERSVASCDVLLVLIGPEWLSATGETGGRRLDEEGDVVRLEIEAGLRHERIVIPALVQNAAMPAEEELPASISAFTRRNAMDLSDERWHYDVDRLAKAIDQAAADAGRPGSVTPRATENLPIGVELAGYELVEPVARSGLSTLYRAIDQRSGTNAALKLFAPELADDRKFRRRLERDAALAASIAHPHIIEVYEIGEEQGVLFIARRWVEGTDLRKAIESHGALGPSRAGRLVFQAADALEAAHGIGLVHANVHPGNLLISRRDDLSITDFGLTKHAISTRGITRTGQWIGTVDYVAPEQVKGLPATAQSDVYSLGCVLFECLTDHVPYPEATAVKKLWAHCEQPPPSFDPYPHVAESLREVVHRATAKEPSERYASVAEFGRSALAAATASKGGGVGAL